MSGDGESSRVAMEYPMLSGAPPSRQLGEVSRVPLQEGPQIDEVEVCLRRARAH